MFYLEYENNNQLKHINKQIQEILPETFKVGDLVSNYEDSEKSVFLTGVILETSEKKLIFYLLPNNHDKKTWLNIENEKQTTVEIDEKEFKNILVRISKKHKTDKIVFLLYET